MCKMCKLRLEDMSNPGNELADEVLTSGKLACIVTLKEPTGEKIYGFIVHPDPRETYQIIDIFEACCGKRASSWILSGLGQKAGIHINLRQHRDYDPPGWINEELTFTQLVRKNVAPGFVILVDVVGNTAIPNMVGGFDYVPSIIENHAMRLLHPVSFSLDITR